MSALSKYLNLDDWDIHSGRVISNLVQQDIKSSNSRDTKKYVNLSSLLYMVCPRYYYLLWDTPDILKESAGSSSMKNVWVIGKALEEHVVSGLIEYYGKSNCLGKWQCKCGAISKNGFIDKVTKCKKCNSLNDIYSEFDLTSDEYGIVGHPDFVARYKGKLLVYEFKSTKIDTYKEILEGNLSSSTEQMMAKHRLQGISYIKLLRKLGYEVHDRLMLTYIAKDYAIGCTPYNIVQCIPTDIENNSLLDMFTKSKNILSYKNNKTLPERTCSTKEEGNCKQCKIVEHCFKLPNSNNS